MLRKTQNFKITEQRVHLISLFFFKFILPLINWLLRIEIEIFQEILQICFDVVFSSISHFFSIFHHFRDDIQEDCVCNFPTEIIFQSDNKTSDFTLKGLSFPMVYRFVWRCWFWYIYWVLDSLRTPFWSFFFLLFPPWITLGTFFFMFFRNDSRNGR